MRRFHKIAVALSLAIFANFVVSSASALTVEQVIDHLEINASKVSSLECVLDCRALSRGGYGVVLADVREKHHFWCDKERRIVRDKRETGPDAEREELWNAHSRKLQVKTATSVTEFEWLVRDEDFAQAWPGSGYLYFPKLLMSGVNWSVSNESAGVVRLTSKPAGAPAGQIGAQHTEIDVDMKKGVMLEVRTYVRDGTLQTRLWFLSFENVAGVWCPMRIRRRINARQNVLDYEFIVEEVVVNQVSANALRLE